MKQRKHFFISLCFLLAAASSFSQSPPGVGLDIGMMAPDIRLPNTAGDTVALSSLRGKIVLIDFWASWCAPCLKEQPELKMIYQNYQHTAFTNGDGFTIYAVSLDSKKTNWINAINKMKMDWPQVSDLKYWDAAPAKLYHLEGIPYNFLIDGNGIIIAKDIHGIDLVNELKKLEKGS
jgi:peroxiredoxin